MNTALVRLTTESIKGEFDNQFDDGIKLGKNSSIALQNISFMTNPTQIIIDADNDDITFNVSQNIQYTIKLDSGVYTFENFQTLLDEIAAKMNQAMVFTGRSIGYTWQLSINSNNKVVIAFRQARATPLNNAWPYFNKIIFNNSHITTPTSDNWKRNGGVVGSKDSFVSIDYPISFGTGFNMGKIRNLLPNTDPGSGASQNVGIVFGLTTIKPSTKSSFSFSNIKYGIYAGKAGEDYYTITDGVASGTAQAIGYLGANNNNNDFIAMRINQGQIEYCVTPNGTAAANPVILNTELYDGKTSLYPLLLFIDATCGVTDYKIGLNEFKIENASVDNGPVDDELIGATGPPAQSIQRGDHSIEFESITLAQFLGYNSANQPPNLVPLSAAQSGSFEAQNEFKITASSDNYIVELESYPLNSYDGFDSKRRSIIATIPQDDSASNVIQYTPPYPTFINFRNIKYENTIHNLRLRLLDKDLTPVSTIGLSSVTLILKSDPIE